jgi:uncharacterized protein YecE (DUF72 family)
MPLAANDGACNVRIGIAGWAMPAALSDKSPEPLSHLEQYSQYFNAVEINSSFYRPHRRHSYKRWSASVPPSFRFAVKMPKSISHERRLAGCADELSAFLHSAAGLGEKLGVLLLQLPPSAVFDEGVVREFLKLLTDQTTAKIVCEPRNPSWFVPAAGELLARFGVTRVSAHPVPRHCPDTVPENSAFVYLRLHGAPRMYYSAYSAEFLAAIRSQMTLTRHGEAWCIFDNTAEGAAWPNARSLLELI